MYMQGCWATATRGAHTNPPQHYGACATLTNDTNIVSATFQLKAVPPALPCRRPRVNPATLVVSGYVFCYPCVFGWVAQHRCSPVTRQPATLDHARRLFEAL